MLVLVPESGDGIQTLKSGVMESADLFVVNKADRPGADKLRQEIEVTLGIRRGNAFRNVPAHHGRARSGGRRAHGRRRRDRRPRPPPGSIRWSSPSPPRARASTELVAALDRHHDVARAERHARASAGAGGCCDRTREVVDRATRRWIWEETRAEQLIAERLDEVVDGRLSPYDVAAEVLDGLKQGERI